MSLQSLSQKNVDDNRKDRPSRNQRQDLTGRQHREERSESRTGLWFWEE